MQFPNYREVTCNGPFSGSLIHLALYSDLHTPSHAHDVGETFTATMCLSGYVWLHHKTRLTVCFLQTEHIEEGLWMVPMNLQRKDASKCQNVRQVTQ